MTTTLDPTGHLPLSPRDFLVLLVLADSPLHGWGILRAVEDRVGDEVRLDPANLYRSLRRMRRDGVVEEAEGEEGAPTDQRRVFALTELGRRVVSAEAARLARLADVARDADLLPSRGGG